MWKFPVKKEVVGITSNSDSFKIINIEKQVEIPVKPHCGAFGAVRKFDVHKGVDLYAPDGTYVFAVEFGRVVDIRPFTGASIGYPWWNETQAVTIEGESGNVVYGEIKVDPVLKINQTVSAGQCLGVVKTVLMKDKGRPMSMLHFALHHHDVLSNGRWQPGKPQPVGLLDPTQFLMEAGGVV